MSIDPEDPTRMAQALLVAGAIVLAALLFAWFVEWI